MRLTRLVLVSALMLMIAWHGCGASYAQQGSSRPATDTRAAQTLQLCREVLLEATRCKTAEEFYKAQIGELKAGATNLEAQIALKNAAIANYEKAIEARTAAEAKVAEIRAVYEKQIAACEKELAKEQQRAGFWKRFAAFGTVAGIVIGAAVVYAASR